MIKSNKQLKEFYSNETAKLSTDKDARTTPRCIHFGVCGGCTLQSITYEAQLGLKKFALREIFAEILPTEYPIELIPAPQKYEYRLKMDYVIVADPIVAPHERLGLRKKRRFNHVVDLETCHLIPPKDFKALREVYNFAKDLNLDNYDLVKNTGFLRYFVFRGYADQKMLNIVTNSSENKDALEKIANFAISEKNFNSVYWVDHPEDKDEPVGTVVQHWGDEYLNIKIGNLELFCGPHTFFQNNINGFTELLNFISTEINKLAVTENLYDLYCGVGTIGLYLANNFSQVYGVELNADSISLASKNAIHNSVSNVEFFHGSVDDLLGLSNKLSLLKNQTVVVDPPRNGLGAKGLAELMRLDPQNIIYISCNPITQAQDMKVLLEGYRIVSCRAFDLFPQTLHLENVIIMTKLALI